MSKLIVVIGFMGSGKTEVASRLARQLHLQFIDLDELITETRGRSPAQFIRDDGEGTFRTVETEVLMDLLNTNKDGVVALGGGAWIESVNRKLITNSGAISVWLDTPFAACWERISTSSEDRPLGATRADAQTRYNERRSIYQLADIVINASQGDPDLLASRIHENISEFRKD
jgi:shikimate kinase